MSAVVIQKILWNKYEQIKNTNPHYSRRAYAKKLGISSGTLSLIMNGKRKISKKMALKFANNLNLSSENVKQIASVFSDINKPNQQNKQIEYIKLEMEQFKVITDWYHYAILSLIKVDNFQSNSDWISKRLGITKNQAQHAIDRLISTKLISIVDGVFKRSHSNLITSDEVKNDLLRVSHKNNLILASKKIDEISLEKRDFTAITMAINPNKISSAKKMIRDFQNNLSSFLEADEKKEVYKMCIQLFPLTK